MIFGPSMEAMIMANRYQALMMGNGAWNLSGRGRYGERSKEG